MLQFQADFLQKSVNFQSSLTDSLCSVERANFASILQTKVQNLDRIWRYILVMDYLPRYDGRLPKSQGHILRPSRSVKRLLTTYT